MIFLIACLNTCVGLLCCCSEYFVTLIPAPGYKGWVMIFALVSMAVSNAGLTQILAVSVPVLNAIYPVAIVLIFLALSDRLVRSRREIYVGAVLCAGVVSLFCALEQSGVLGETAGEAIEGALGWLPGYGLGLGWILPGAAGILAGLAVWSIRGKTSEKAED